MDEHDFCVIEDCGPCQDEAAREFNDEQAADIERFGY